MGKTIATQTTQTQLMGHINLVKNGSKLTTVLRVNVTYFIVKATFQGDSF